MNCWDSFCPVLQRPWRCNSITLIPYICNNSDRTVTLFWCKKNRHCPLMHDLTNITQYTHPYDSEHKLWRSPRTEESRDWTTAEPPLCQTQFAQRLVMKTRWRVLVSQSKHSWDSEKRITLWRRGNIGAKRLSDLVTNLRTCPSERIVMKTQMFVLKKHTAWLNSSEPIVVRQLLEGQFLPQPKSTSTALICHTSSEEALKNLARDFFKCQLLSYFTAVIRL